MRMLGYFLVASSIALTGCEKPQGLQVVDPAIRLSANPKAPSVGYFTMKGGPTADRLLSVTSPVVIRIELHESMMAGTMASMKPLDGGVDLPANGTVKFAEGGKHLMLFNINPGVKAGENIQLNFTFASGAILRAFAPVNAPGS